MHVSGDESLTRGRQGCGGIPPPGALYNLDVGVPVTMCAETSPGVFGRNYTNGWAQLDCNTYTATLAFS